MEVDLNSDLGESFGHFKLGADEEIMRYISSANIACGFHAGDPIIMRKTLRLAKEHNIAVGAHPSYPDLLGFGRRYLSINKEEARNYMLYQLGALEAFARAEGMKLQHVKPHGALYNALQKDEELARGISEGISDFNKNLIFVGLANSRSLEIAKEIGLKVINEVFADRRYNKDGTLVSRKLPGAVLTDKGEIAKHVISATKEGRIRSIEGEWIELKTETICVHGDNPKATEIVAYLRRSLEGEGIKIVPMREIVR
jgi:UPF0271 protein